jgi:hypothetical protein
VSRPVPLFPSLPRSPNAPVLDQMVQFDADLTRSLFLYLSDLARRANDALTADGESPMEGDLNLGGNDIFNVNNIAVNQLTFPATQVPSADGHTLDDYEEDVWTPTLYFNNANVGMTFTQRLGRYWKIGKHVFLWWDVILSAKGSSVGQPSIGRGTVAGADLPFPVAEITGAGFITYADSVTGLTGSLAAHSSVAGHIPMYQWGSGGMAGLTEANFTNTSRIIGWNHYITTN